MKRIARMILVAGALTLGLSLIPTQQAQASASYYKDSWGNCAFTCPFNCPCIDV